MSQSWGVNIFQIYISGKMATNIRNWGTNARQKLNARHFCFLSSFNMKWTLYYKIVQKWTHFLPVLPLKWKKYEKKSDFYLSIDIYNYIDSKKKLKVDISRTFDWMEPCDFRGLGLKNRDIYKNLIAFSSVVIN